MPPIYFSTWLMQQRYRNDEVGKVAQWAVMVKLYKSCKAYQDFANIFSQLAPDYLLAFLPIVEEEYRLFLEEKKKRTAEILNRSF